MKSQIKAILLLTVMVCYAQSKLFSLKRFVKADEDPNQSKPVKNYLKEVNESTKKQINHNHKKLRLHRQRSTVSDAYKEITRLQNEDKKVLEDGEAKRLKYIKIKEELKKECKDEKAKADGLEILVKQKDNLIDEWTRTKSTYDDSKLIFDTQVIQYQKDYVTQDQQLKEQQGKTDTLQTSVTKIKLQIQTKKTEIIQLQKQIEQATQSQKQFEAQLVQETTQMSGLSTLIQKQTIKCTEITTCITKKNTEIDIVAKNITEAHQQITTSTSLKKQLENNEYNPQLKKSEDCKVKEKENDKDIESIQNEITKLKMRICAYFTNGKQIKTSVDIAQQTLTELPDETPGPKQKIIQNIGKTSANYGDPQKTQQKQYISPNPTQQLTDTEQPLPDETPGPKQKIIQNIGKNSANYGEPQKTLKNKTDKPKWNSSTNTQKKSTRNH